MQPPRFQLENATSFSHYHDIYLLILNHLLFFFSSSQVLVFLTSHALFVLYLNAVYVTPHTLFPVLSTFVTILIFPLLDLRRQDEILKHRQ